MKNKLSSLFLLLFFCVSVSAKTCLETPQRTAQILNQSISAIQKTKFLAYLVSLKKLYEYLSEKTDQFTWQRMNDAEYAQFLQQIDILAHQVASNAVDLKRAFTYDFYSPKMLERIVEEIEKKINPLSAITRLGARSRAKEICKELTNLMNSLQ